MAKKYELIMDKTKEIKGKTLYQIKALKDFTIQQTGTEIHTGELGGWVEKEDNLSHNGNSWIMKSACVFDEAFVKDNAVITESAKIFGNAIIAEDVYIKGKAKVFDYAMVLGDVHIGGKAQIGGQAIIS